MKNLKYLPLLTVFIAMNANAWTVVTTAATFGSTFGSTVTSKVVENEIHENAQMNAEFNLRANEMQMRQNQFFNQSNYRVQFKKVNVDAVDFLVSEGARQTGALRNFLGMIRSDAHNENMTSIEEMTDSQILDLLFSCPATL